MSMCVLTPVCNASTLTYLKYTRAINTLYCLKHDYKYILDGVSPRLDRHMAWCKISTLKKYLPKCEYLLMLDADAFFVDLDTKIESLIELMDDRLFLFGTDVMSPLINIIPEGEDEQNWINTGVVLMKSCEKTRHIVDEWNNVPIEHPQFKQNHLWDQGAFREILLPKYREYIKVLNYPESNKMNGHRGTFIKHLAGIPNYVREEILKTIIQDIHCDFITQEQ